MRPSVFVRQRGRLVKKLCVGFVALGMLSIAAPAFANGLVGAGVLTATATVGGAEQGVAWHGVCQLISATERLSQSPDRLHWGVIALDGAAYRPGALRTPVAGSMECFLRDSYYEVPYARVVASSSSGVFSATARASYEATPALQLCFRLYVDGQWWIWEQCSPVSLLEV